MNVRRVQQIDKSVDDAVGIFKARETHPPSIFNSSDAGPSSRTGTIDWRSGCGFASHPSFVCRIAATTEVLILQSMITGRGKAATQPGKSGTAPSASDRYNSSKR